MGASHGLQWRLTAWVAAVLLTSSAALFAVVHHESGAQLRSEIDRAISDDSAQLAQALQSSGARTPEQLATAARGYVESQPFTAASRLLFAAVPGQATVSNHPEVFGRAGPESTESRQEQSTENAMGRQLLLHSAVGYSVHSLPDAGDVRVHTRRVMLARVSVLVGAGEPLELVEHAEHSVATAFLLAGAVALLIALVASYLAGSHVSAPLRQMAAVATRVDAGDLSPRIHAPASRPREVQVMADAFNHMLDRLDEAFAGQRAFVADASHELRTPLTVIRGQLEVLAGERNPTREDIRRVEELVSVEIARISRLVDDLLLLAQAERTDFLRSREIDVPTFVGDVWEGLSHTAERRFELRDVPDGTLVADPDRLAQALGNLVRNAIAHTRPGDGLVRLELRAEPPDMLALRVIDDGPGIPAAERERVFERFHRVDASRTRASGGTGLGLAIVRAIAEAHGGRAQVREHPPRGTEVEIVLPGFATRIAPVAHRYAAPR